MTEKKIPRDQQNIGFLRRDPISNLLKARAVHPPPHVDVADLREAKSRKCAWKPRQFQAYGFDFKPMEIH